MTHKGVSYTLAVSTLPREVALSESLLELRHPDLARLYTIWKLMCADQRHAAVDADLLLDFKDNVLIVERDDQDGSMREIHAGAELDSDACSHEAVVTAIVEVARLQRPLSFEDSNIMDERQTMLVLPFLGTTAGATRVVVAIYPARM